MEDRVLCEWGLLSYGGRSRSIRYSVWSGRRFLESLAAGCVLQVVREPELSPVRCAVEVYVSGESVRWAYV